MASPPRRGWRGRAPSSGGRAAGPRRPARRRSATFAVASGPSHRVRLGGCLLGVVELALDQVEAHVPEAWIGQVDPDDPAELLGREGPAGAQHLHVAGDEALALLDIALVDRQREQLAVRIGVDVAGCGREVVHVGPPGAVAVGDLHRVAEQLLLGLGPQLAYPVWRQLAGLAALGA